MAVSPSSSSSLDLTMSMPGSFVSSGERGLVVRDFDMNQVPSEKDEFEDEEEDATNEGPPRKKLRLSKDQSRLLEESFRQHHTLNPRQKEGLATQLKLRPRQVEVWFQNRRARSKLKQTEMECEFLKRWFGMLKEQNRRLQREVEELRAMKVGPPTVISPHNSEPLPASTLTMCPRCERVTAVDKGPTRTTTTSTAASLSSKVETASIQSPQSSTANLLV
ncbi:homeobox-leucine zipper protein HOX3 [Euphorbia lathyris]|uniref:homeobox-leucine zipper protein HOX3 n=1 Tax=Euphorbia lathyris TaxID=212925 RepID=UPI0033131DF8